MHDAHGRGVRLRRCQAAEFPQFYERLARTFGLDVVEDDRDVFAGIFEHDRSVVGVDGPHVVATAAMASRSIAVPGAVVPLAAVMMVSVAPTHRRRGVLTALMRQQLDELHEAGGEAVAGLYAAEAGIYGRFGYGLATRRAVMTGETREMAVRGDLTLTGGRMREPELDEAMPIVAALYEGLQPRRTGWLSRSPGWWERQVRPLGHGRDGVTATRIVLCEDEHGRPVGYALYEVRSEQAFEPPCEAVVGEVVAESPDGYAALWKFLAELDLVDRVRRELAPVDEPLQHMLLNPRAVQLAVRDGLWARLADVPRALAQRRYATEVDAVMEVVDPFCPWNEGRWRLAGGPDGAVCERTPSEPDLVVGVSELGAAYLGGTTLSALGAAGRVDERSVGALAHLSRAMRSDTLVFCPEIF